MSDGRLEKRAGCPHVWYRAATVFVIAMLLACAVPAFASKYQYDYVSPTATVQAPSVSLQTGNSGTPSISAVAPNAASGTLTAGIPFYNSATATTDALAVAASGIGTGNGVATQATGSFAVAAGDLIYVSIVLVNSGSQTVTSVTDNRGSAYHFRQFAVEGTAVRVETWWTAYTSASVTVTVTAHLSATARVTIIAMSIRGVNTNSPFDPSVTTAPTNQGTTGTATASVSTSFPNDMLIGAVGLTSNTATTADTGAGFAQVTTENSGTVLRNSVEDAVVTTTESSLAVTYTWTGTHNWAFIVDALVAGTAPPGSDTVLSPPSGTGSTTLSRSSSLFLWSGAFTTGSSLYAGSWVLNLWASGATAGTITVSIWVVNSTGAIKLDVLSAPVSTASISAKAAYKSAILGLATAIPSNDQVMVVLTAPSTGPTSFTVFWGSGQTTYFQTPSTYSYLLVIANGASTTWTVSLASANSLASNAGRLTNVTIWFVSPFSVQLVYGTSGFSQPSGAGNTLGSLGTIDIAVAAYANAIPTATNVPSTITFILKVVSSSSTAFAQYTVNLSID